jgi:catalase
LAATFDPEEGTWDLRCDGNGGGAGTDEAPRVGRPVEDPPYLEPPLPMDGDAGRYEHRAGTDDDTQAGHRCRLWPADGQPRVFGHLAASMPGGPRVIVDRPLEQFSTADPVYGEGVAKALGLRGQGHTAPAAA